MSLPQLPESLHPDAWSQHCKRVGTPIGRSLGSRVSLAVAALNVFNSHLLVDNSLTFGGTHFNSPREIYAELRYRFHY